LMLFLAEEGGSLLLDKGRAGRGCAGRQGTARHRPHGPFADGDTTRGLAWRNWPQRPSPVEARQRQRQPAGLPCHF
jgi:hypothetical protein